MHPPYTVTIPKGSRVLVLEDHDTRIGWFEKRLSNVKVAKTAQEAIEALTTEQFDFVFLDHDLGGVVVYKDRVEVVQNHEETGAFVAEFMANRGFIGKHVLIHSWNSAGVYRMQAALRHANAIAFGEFELVEK